MFMIFYRYKEGGVSVNETLSIVVFRGVTTVIGKSSFSNGLLPSLED